MSPDQGLGARCLRPGVAEVCDCAQNRQGEGERGEPQRPSCTPRTAIAHDSDDHERRQGQDGWKLREKQVARDAFGRDRVDRRPDKERNQGKQC